MSVHILNGRSSSKSDNHLQCRSGRAREELILVNTKDSIGTTFKHVVLLTPKR
jgi:hypothetical protein